MKARYNLESEIKKTFQNLRWSAILPPYTCAGRCIFLLRIKVLCVEIAFPEITKEMCFIRHLAKGFSGGRLLQIVVKNTWLSSRDDSDTV